MHDAPILHLETVASTMDEMAALLASGNVKPWTAVLADFQSKGRGRANRAWHAPAGSALLSTIYAPILLDPERAGLLAIAAGLAVADALTRYDVAAQLKWPNDVLVTERKLAGILITTRIAVRLQASVGIGLNLTDSPPGAISLAELTPSPPSATEMLEQIRGAMRKRWTQLERGLFTSLRDDWNAVAAWKGQLVLVPGDDLVRGRLCGIDERGRLRIETVAGEKTIAQNEIVRGPVLAGRDSYTSR